MNRALLMLFAISLFSISSCKKDDTETCTPTDTTQTYTAKVKPILDTHCIASGCHDAATHSGGVTLTNYTGAMSATKNNNLISQLQSGLMPQGMPRLPDSTINQIVAWKDNCYQE